MARKKSSARRPSERGREESVGGTIGAAPPSKKKWYPRQAKQDSPKYKAAKCWVIGLNAVTLLFGIALCGFGFYTATQGGAFSVAWVIYIAGSVGIALIFVSMLGLLGACCQNQSMLLLYVSLLLLLALMLCISGGFCLVLVDQAIATIQSQYQELLSAGVITGSVSQVENAVKRDMYVIGGVCLFLAVCLWFLIGRVMKMVTVKRAMSTMLQVLTLLLLPLGMMIVAAGVYVMETAAFASAPITALIMFGLGILVVSLSMLGCFGTAVEGRKMLSLFGNLVALLATVFLALGIVSFVQADMLKGWVVANWQQVRQVLPPTFTGRYDREYFKAFVSSNLKALGFLSLVLAGYLLTCNFMSFVLGNVLEISHIKKDKDRQATRKRAASATPAAQKKMMKEWERRWTKGNKSERRVVKLGCCGCCFLLFLVAAGGITLLLFQAFCTTFTSVSKVTTFKGAASTAQNVFVYSSYEKGLTKLQRDVGNSVYFTLTTSAIRPEFAATNSVLKFAPQNATFSAVPSRGQLQVLRYDLACQVGDVAVNLPKDSSKMALTIATNSSAGIDLTLPPEDKGPFEQLIADGGQGGILGSNLRIGSANGRGVFHALSSSGDIILAGVQAQCGAAWLGSPNAEVRLSSDLGLVNLTSFNLVNCMLNVSNGAAPVVVGAFSGTSVSGGVKQSSAVAKFNTVSGRVQLDSFTSDSLSITTRSGAVSATSVDARFVRIGSNSGLVNVSKLFPNPDDGNNLQVETTASNVYVSIAPDGFKGQFTLSSSSGLVTVTRDGKPLPACPICVTTCSIDPTLSNCQPDGRLCDLYCRSSNTTAAQSGRIGCLDSECGYYGEVLITSDSGAISLDLLV